MLNEDWHLFASAAVRAWRWPSKRFKNNYKERSLKQADRSLYSNVPAGESCLTINNWEVCMEIKKICVLGAGLMGNGIAQVCATAGYDVTLRDIEQRFIDGGMNTIKKNLSRDAEKGKITQEQMDVILGRIKPTLDLKEAAANADVVVEVVIELMDLKKKVYAEL